ncbi:putative methanogenesis regulatory protein FilR2 [uncultured archaeon]|nr:putative methanogenesis regulatory protein FilR2 [uncultured archaeon]
MDKSATEKHDLAILLVEDNPVNQKVATVMLKRLGYTTDVAVSGSEALQALEHKSYDLILMDIQMPDMDGLETTCRIRERNTSQGQPCVVAMTAYALDDDRDEFVQAGMNDYLSKPIRMEELRRILDRCEKKVSTSVHKLL